MPTLSRRTVLTATASATSFTSRTATAHAAEREPEPQAYRPWIGRTVTGDPRVHGRVRLAGSGRRIQYGEPV